MTVFSALPLLLLPLGGHCAGQDLPMHREGLKQSASIAPFRRAEGPHTTPKIHSSFTKSTLLSRCCYLLSKQL